MVSLTLRLEALTALGQYLLHPDDAWATAVRKAEAANPWFTTEFIKLGVHNIAQQYLQAQPLRLLVEAYGLERYTPTPKKVGIVMAGNLPLVGFHDLLCTFLSGHTAVVKLSSKDEVLPTMVIQKLTHFHPSLGDAIRIETFLKGCDAYIATGSNNSGRYFDFYFGKYPNLIRRNRTSVAVLTGAESGEELEGLADDICLYFGLGCRNVTQLWVPKDYPFEPLIAALNKWKHLELHNKYKNNYDYNLTGHILNNRYYMTNGAVLLVEDPSPFSAIAQVHFQHYGSIEDLPHFYEDDHIQTVVGRGFTPFGKAQQPGIDNWADGADTLAFLTRL